MATNPEELLNAQDAAAYMGVSERTLRNHVQKGALKARRAPRQQGEAVAPVLYGRADLDAIKAGNPNQYPVEPDKRTGVPGPPLARQIAAADGAGAAVAKAPESNPVLPAALPQALVLEVARMFAELRDRPRSAAWFTVDQASAASGIPEATLRRIAPRLAARGDALRTRSGWIIRLSALDGPVPPPSA